MPKLAAAIILIYLGIALFALPPQPYAPTILRARVRRAHHHRPPCLPHIPGLPLIHHRANC